jgi:hypothetical protein
MMFFPLYVMYSAVKIALKTSPKQYQTELPTAVSPQPRPPYVGPSPEPFSCNLSENQCQTVINMKKAIESNNFEELVTYFQEQTQTCQGGDEWSPCYKKPVGSVIHGYFIGISQGEGGLEDKENIVDSLNREVQISGPYTFQKFNFDTTKDQGELEYLDSTKTAMLYFELVNVNGQIKIKFVVVGHSYEYLEHEFR